MSENPVKQADPDHEILDYLAQRWSPYVFAPRPVEGEKLLSCLEAARWAASSYNEQPWSFIVAERDNEAEFTTMLGCLVEGNQGWAAQAGVLMLSVAQQTFSRNGKPNRACEHDIGLAAANLTVQATALGLVVHQMVGIEISKCRQTYRIPEGYAPLTGIALGYAGTAAQAADEQFAERDRASRQRKPLQEFVFRGQWGQAGV